MNWMDKTCGEMSELGNKNVKWKDFPKRLKLKIRLLHFYWDWLTLDAIKSGFKMPRLQFKSWLFYIKHPYLKRDKS